MFSFCLDSMLLHMEIVHATGSENESNGINIYPSIVSYNYTFISFSLQYIYLHRLESVTDSTSSASIVSTCKSIESG